MIQNIYLFTGQETYLLDKELLRRKENFLQKFGPDSIFSFSLDNLDISQIKQAIYSSGLFTTKKLILINGLPLDASTKLGEEKNEELQIFIDALIKAEGKIPADSLIVFINSTPDKRLKLYKFLEKNAIVKEFAQLKNNDLEGFVKKELSECLIDHDTIQYFLTKVGSDLYRIWFECDKLKTRTQIKQQKKIDEAMIDLVVFGQVETDSFALLKTLFADKVRGIEILEKIQNGGADRNQFLGMLYRAMKFYIFMLDLDEYGITDSKEIASFLKMNPWQVKNEYAKIGVLKSNKKNIENFYKGLIELDAGIKSGKYPDIYFWLGVKKLINGVVKK
ncbi:MAG: DNA polymerase III subunit delta [candidate division SR1 bacterium]|nr:DNA polymerase III subunit delta [candidate division SR1 bacterium]